MYSHTWVEKMCESKVTVHYNAQEHKFKDVIQLIINDSSLTLVMIDGSRHEFKGFKKVAKIEGDFIKHVVLVVLE